MKTTKDAERAWQIMVSLVMETRGDWKREVSEATGMPFSRMRALWRLEDAARTHSELAQMLGTDAPAASVIVNDLEQRGLVLRETHPDDRRAKLVSLTEDGRNMLMAVDRIKDKPPASIADLPPSRLIQLRQILERATT